MPQGLKVWWRKNEWIRLDGLMSQRAMRTMEPDHPRRVSLSGVSRYLVACSLPFLACFLIFSADLNSKPSFSLKAYPNYSSLPGPSLFLQHLSLPPQSNV